MTVTPSGGSAALSALDATPAGLLTTSVDGDTLAYNTAQQLTSSTPLLGTPSVFAYDARGQRVSTTTGTDVTSYAHTPSGALASVTTPSAVVSYTSDARNLRQSRTVGSTTQQFTWSSVGGLPLLLDDGEHSYVYGASSTPLAQVDDTTGLVQYLHADLLGTPRLVTDSAGSPVGSTSLDAFGTVSAQSGVQSAFGFTGNWSDPDTGLLYLRARDYDPVTGQFLAVDPAVDETRQPYAYTGNNPVSFVDPSGLCPVNGGSNTPDCTPEDFGGNSGLLSEQSLVVGDVLNSQSARNVSSLFAGIIDTLTFNPWLIPLGATSVTGLIRNLTAPGWTCQYEQNGYFTFGAIWAGAATAAVGGVGAASGSSLRIATANFAQTTARNSFSAGGRFANQTISSVAEGIRAGSIPIAQVPIDVIARGGNTLILNTRSALALTEAGVSRSAWNVINRTGQDFYETLLTSQLANNGLTELGIAAVRITGR